jgi:hypothetical protein
MAGPRIRVTAGTEVSGFRREVMGIIELPVWRLRGELPPRAALRSGVALSQPVMRVLQPFEEVAARADYCDRCAAPIEFGAVTKGTGIYCSVECSLEGPGRPA